MQFREQALAALETPEELDVPVRLTRPRTWLVLAALGLVVVAGMGWAVAGSLPRQVSAAGVVMYPQGGYRMPSTATGVVTQILVTPGQFVPAGAPVAGVTADRRTQQVLAATAGKVTEVLLQPGQPVATGAPLLVMERVAKANDRLVAILYLSGADAVGVERGRRVDLEVQSAPARTFGTVRGTVVATDPTPQTKAQITSFLGDEALAGRLAGSGSALKVVVALHPADTPSGFGWSAGTGPPFQIACRTSVTGRVRLPPVRPIQLVLPR